MSSGKQSQDCGRKADGKKLKKKPLKKKKKDSS
jgi:hypothetical protein